MDEFADWVVRIIRDVPGLDASAHGRGRIEVKRGRGPSASFRVRQQGRVASGDLDWRLQDVANRQELIATHRLSRGMRDRLAGAGASWVERDTGVVHLDAERLFVHIEPAVLPTQPSADGWTLTSAGITGVLIEAIIDAYRDRTFTLRETAELTGATKGHVSQVLTKLVRSGFVEAEGQTRNRVYRVPAPGRMLREWARSGPTPKESNTALYAWSRSPGELYRRLGALDDHKIRWALGGAAAANAYVPTLTVPPPPELWVQADTPAEQIAQALDAEIVGSEEAPNLTLWQTSGDPALVLRRRVVSPEFSDLHLWLVSKPRAYVEAQAGGGRAVDAAEALREEMAL